MIKFLSIGLTAISFILLPQANVSALTLNQFQKICTSSPMPCDSNPMLQAYIGGSFDTLAVLNEQIGTTPRLYCIPGDELFDVNKTIQYLASAEGNEHNAMLMVLKYVRERGKCADRNAPGQEGES